MAKNPNSYLNPKYVFSLLSLFVILVLTFVACKTNKEELLSREESGISVQALETSTNVHMFYYPWYGSPEFDLGKPNIGSSGWRHWTQNLEGSHTPPEYIGSNYYPTLGAYSSASEEVLDQHMQWIQNAGAGVVVMSWWGQDSWEDNHTLQVLNAADAKGLKVAFLLEPYKDSSVSKLKEDIKYIYDNYGSHPAFYRVARATKYGPSTSPRGVFYVFNVSPINSLSSWRSMLDSIRGTADDAIVISLGISSNPIEDGHFDGIYSYGVHNVGQDPFTSFAKRARESNGIYSPSVGPGYDERRAVPSTHRYTSRDNGAYYDRLWQTAIDSGSEWISISTFNEWHEGSQIEPAKVKNVADYPYENYEGAYGKTGKDAQTSYLDRTRYWVNIYAGFSGGGNDSPPTTPPPDPSPNPNTFETRVNSSSNDAEERSHGGVNLDSSDLELTYDGGHQTIGIRFTDVRIPQGTQITSAHIQFTTDEVSTQETNLRIKGYDLDNTSPFSSTSNSISSKPMTSASTSWSPAPWPTRGESGEAQKTPNLAAIVQEIVGRPGWDSGNAMTFVITGTGERTAESYDGEPTGAPLLRIEYTSDSDGGSDNSTPNIISFTADLVSTQTNELTTLDISAQVNDEIKFQWNADGDSLTCSLDVDGDGNDEFNFSDCKTTTSQSYRYTSAGSYQAVLTVTDANGASASATENVTVTEPTTSPPDPSSNPSTFETRVNSSSNDAEEKDYGGVNLDSSDLELTYDDGGYQTIGIRFTDVNIPQGTQITSAHIQFTTDEASTQETNLRIKGYDLDNTSPFSSASNSISSKPMTSASTSWSPAPWPTRGESGEAQKTPNLTAIVQEIVGRPGWDSGNAMTFVITGTGERTAESYDGEPTGAPLLRIEYASDSDGGSDTSDPPPLPPPPPPPSTSVTVAAAGDIACDPDSSRFNNGEGTDSSCHMKAVAELIETMNPVAVLPLGDLQYEDAEFWKFEESYGPSWGRFNNIAYPAVGNHEYLTHDAEGYFNYFGSRAGDPDKGYYSYDKGNWHLIALNTNCGRVEGGCSTGGLQEQWLRNDLANTSANCVLAYAHHPRFSSGNHGNNSSIEDLWEALYDYDAELFLSGHDHNYERFAPLKPNGELDTSRGIVQFVVGTGGKSTRSMNSPERYSEFRDSDNHGALKLTLHSQSYDWEFVSDTGVVIDSGSANCH